MRFFVALICTTALVPTAAIAEEAIVQSGPDSNETSAERQPQSDAGSYSGEILVTAQRRSERLQDVPISVTALTQDSLASAGISGTQDLAQVTPGLVFARSSAFAQPTIRGIGSRSGGLGDEPNVATYIDGVYQPLQATNAQELSAIDRVEVLKGPQGTLFGRNATGGAINILTRKPEFNFAGDVSATAGEFSYTKFSAFLTGPITDTLAASINLVNVHDEGYISNAFLGGKQNPRTTRIARARLLWEPNDRLSINLNGLYSFNSDPTTFSGHIIDGNSITRRTPNPNNYPLDVIIPSGDYETSSSLRTANRVRQYTGDLHIDYDFGFATLSALASIADSRVYTQSDTDLSPLNVSGAIQVQQARSYTQELLLTSNGSGRLQWILGANALQDNERFDPSISNFEFAPSPRFITAKTRAQAVFGELTFEAVDGLFLTGGVRFTHDVKEATFQTVPLNPAAGGQGRSNDTALTFRGVARYEFSPRLSVYGSFSQGYKSPAFNPLTAAGASTPAKAETVDAFEVGMKGRSDWGLQYSLAVYHYSYRDLQSNVSQVNIDPVTGAQTISSILQNADSATIKGLEAQFDYSPTSRLNFQLGLSLLDAKVDNFPNSTEKVIAFFVNGLPAGNANVLTDVSGNDLLRAPDWTINIGAKYTVPLSKGEMTFAANALFSDKYYGDLLNRLEQPAYETVNASITWKPTPEFKFSIFGQNLTNDRVSAVIFTSPFGDYTMFSKPRWFGASVGYEF